MATKKIVDINDQKDCSGKTFSGKTIKRVLASPVIWSHTKRNFSSARMRRTTIQQHSFLRNSIFSDADLSGCTAKRVNFSYSNFFGANLAGANLTGSDFYGARFYRTILTRADLREAFLPSPTEILMANWYGKMPEQLTADLMVYDSSCHPNRKRFTAWARAGANFGSCPYNGTRLERACHFQESREIWRKDIGVECRPYDLMMRLFDAFKVKR